MSEPFIGQIKIVGFTFAPRGWANCDGQLLPISQYEALFSLYGTIYGGDGRQTFALPDLRGRDAIGVGAGPGLPTYTQGAKGGATQVALDANTLAAHTHPFNVPCNSGEAASDSPVDGFPAKTASGEQIYTGSGGAQMGRGATGPTGGSQPHDNMQPYEVLRFVCALTGIYPSRN